MAWLGFVTLLTIYWCFFVAATTGRIGWCLLTGWLLPILALTISFRKGMQVNGLMVLICFVLLHIPAAQLRQPTAADQKQHKADQHHQPGAVLAVIYSDFSADVLQRGAGADAGIYSEYPGLGQ